MVGLNSFQELALIFSSRVGLNLSGPECIPRVGLNFQLKSWP